jgi:hypothetical protein
MSDKAFTTYTRLTDPSRTVIPVVPLPTPQAFATWPSELLQLLRQSNDWCSSFDDVSSPKGQLSILRSDDSGLSLYMPRRIGNERALAQRQQCRLFFESENEQRDIEQFLIVATNTVQVLLDCFTLISRSVDKELKAIFTNQCYSSNSLIATLTYESGILPSTVTAELKNILGPSYTPTSDRGLAYAISSLIDHWTKHDRRQLSFNLD